jgi:shikimate dehydrogenase
MSASDHGRVQGSGSTHTVGVIGWPVAHSLSPAIHNAAFQDLGMPWTYVPLPVEPGRLPAALDGLIALGFAGANVTMPHKTEAAELCDVRSEDVTRLWAANTLVVVGGELHGHNTDAPGFDRFLRRDAGFDPSGRTALLFGAGGAARAVALALATGGLDTLVVALRDPARDAGLRQALDGLPTAIRTVGVADAPDVSADLVVNATPLGLHGERLPVPVLGPGRLVVDLLYHPTVTPLLADARAAGATAFGGLGLLLHQGALSFELWTGSPAPLEVMSAAALGALADRG